MCEREEKSARGGSESGERGARGGSKSGERGARGGSKSGERCKRVARVGREVRERPVQCTDDAKWAWSKKGGMAEGATAGAMVPGSTEVKCGCEDNRASTGPCPAMLKQP